MVAAGPLGTPIVAHHPRGWQRGKCTREYHLCFYPSTLHCPSLYGGTPVCQPTLRPANPSLGMWVTNLYNGLAFLLSGPLNCELCISKKKKQAKVDKAKTILQRVRERQWNKKNKQRVPATYQEGDWVLVHHSRLPAWPRSTSDDPYFGPYKILSVDGHRITVRCSPRLEGTLVCAAQQLKRYYDPEDICGEEWGLNDEEIAALDLQGAASPMEVEGKLPDMNAEEMAKEGFYLVKSVLRHRYRQGWLFLTLSEGFRVKEATWEPFSAFVLPEGRLNSVLVDHLSANNLAELLRLAETLASKTKARD